MILCGTACDVPMISLSISSRLDIIIPRRQVGPVTRASRIDFDDLEATIRRMESECKASWDHLKLIAKHDGPTPMRQKMSEFLADSAERIIVLGIIQRRVINRSEERGRRGQWGSSFR